ncbi:MAG TPA: isochorismatase family protein [Candidatus Baltobacteraceae bacterium]|jgi:nicotinamidase-related amidase|nr:isochorismatase family protein [Candidatus Baltobacteraceae bacterium]
MADSSQLIASRTAFLLVDAEEAFRRRPFWRDDDLAPFLHATQDLLDACVSRGIPIVEILHENTKEGDPFHVDSALVRTFDELIVGRSVTLKKRGHSAFSNLDLEPWLKERNIEEILIGGAIRTERCPASTARDASERGLTVHFILDATLTFPIKDRNGRSFSPEEIKDFCAADLAQNFPGIKIRSSQEMIEEIERLPLRQRSYSGVPLIH